MDIYQLWYEWLWTTDPKDWSEDVRDSFGDCYQPFTDWWPAHKHLFLPAFDPFNIYVVKDEADYRSYVDGSNPDQLVVLFNLTMPRRSLIRALTDLLKERHSGERGKPAHDDCGDVYQLARPANRPTILLLNDMLTAYRRWENEKPRPKQYTIGFDLKLGDGDTTSECKWKKGHKGADSPEGFDSKRVMTATVSRYLKWAKIVRANVMIGIFPPPFKLAKPSLASLTGDDVAR